MTNSEIYDLKARTKQFALRIIHLYSFLPKAAVAQTPGRQVLRSGTSVGANYREAQRGRSKKEFIAKAGDCLKELDETQYWLELLTEAKIVTEQKLAKLLAETRELIAIFVTIINRSKEK